MVTVKIKNKEVEDFKTYLAQLLDFNLERFLVGGYNLENEILFTLETENSQEIELIKNFKQR